VQIFRRKPSLRRFLPNERTNANVITTEQRRAAKVAGISGVLAVAIVVYSNYALLGPLIVSRDAVQTARNILAHQTQFRFALIGFLGYGVIVVVLLSALYFILKRVNHGVAIVGALFRLVFAMLWLLATLNMLSSMRLLSSPPYLRLFEPDRLQALARLHLAANFDDYYVGLPFFGLAATVCAWLWYKSGYVPRGLAAFGIVASAWCVICAFIFLVFPNFEKPVNPYWFDSPMAIFELAVSVWLLIKGLRSPIVDLASR
jgi:Domain of unknown function (DUF4386)